MGVLHSHCYITYCENVLVQNKNFNLLMILWKGSVSRSCLICVAGDVVSEGGGIHFLDGVLIYAS